MRLLRAFGFVVLGACSSLAHDQSFDASSGDDAAIDALLLSVDPERFLDQISPTEHRALCEWMVAIQGGPHTIDCGGGVRVTIDPVEDCLQLQWPHCQVRLLADCVSAQAIDQCASSPPPCTAFYACGL